MWSEKYGGYWGSVLVYPPVNKCGVVLPLGDGFSEEFYVRMGKHVLWG